LPVAGSCPPELVSSVPSECHCWNPQSIPVTPSGAVNANFQKPTIEPLALGALKFGNDIAVAPAERACAALMPPTNCANAFVRALLCGAAASSADTVQASACMATTDPASPIATVAAVTIK
jgi:hypothetical protein